ncbi:MAG TPA: hypothetical protein VK469_01325 [Candidatus Kapabacteria bacterium]|nr:hypothetical protein [Candidatus Kapabacteria bacterium]
MKILFRITKRKLALFTFLILFSMACFGEKLATLKELLKPVYLAMDPYISQFYVTEGASIYIYSLADYNLKAKFGKDGEGPQEFRIIEGSDGLTVLPLKDSLLINSIRRLSFFTKEGSFIKELNTGIGFMAMRFQPIGNGYAALGIVMDEKTTAFSLNLYNDKFEQTKVIQKIKAAQRGLLQFPMISPIFYIVDDKIISMEDESFLINIFDKDGNKVSSITREYERAIVTENYIKEVHDLYKNSPNYKQFYESMKNMFQFSRYFPAIKTFLVADKKVYIQTYLKENGKDEFFIYELNGKFLKRLFLPVVYRNSLKPFPYTIMNNRIYQLIENEDAEVWELHTEKIE